MSVDAEGFSGIVSSREMVATVRNIGSTAAMSVSWVREAHEEVYTGRVIPRGANRLLTRMMGGPIEEGGDHTATRFRRSRHRRKEVVVETGMTGAPVASIDPTEPPELNP